MIESGASPHLLIDFYGCPKEKLEDVGLVFTALDTIPEKIGLTKVSPPNVFKYKGEGAASFGVSGVVMVAQSHISLHTFPDKEHLFVDIFSSHDFNAEQAANEFTRTFEAKSREMSREDNRLNEMVIVPDIEGIAVAPRIYH